MAEHPAGARGTRACACSCISDLLSVPAPEEEGTWLWCWCVMGVLCVGAAGSSVLAVASCVSECPVRVSVCLWDTSSASLLVEPTKGKAAAVSLILGREPRSPGGSWARFAGGGGSSRHPLTFHSAAPLAQLPHLCLGAQTQLPSPPQHQSCLVTCFPEQSFLAPLLPAAMLDEIRAFLWASAGSKTAWTDPQ